MTTKLRAVIALYILFLASFSVNALADGTLTLPTGLKVVEEEAFYGATALDKVVVPEGVATIGSKAFAYSNVNIQGVIDSDLVQKKRGLEKLSIG